MLGRCSSHPVTSRNACILRRKLRCATSHVPPVASKIGGDLYPSTSQTESVEGLGAQAEAALNRLDCRFPVPFAGARTHETKNADGPSRCIESMSSNEGVADAIRSDYPISTLGIRL